MIVKYIETNPVQVEFNNLQRRTMFIEYTASITDYMKDLRSNCTLMTPIAERRFIAFSKFFTAKRAEHRNNFDAFKDAIDMEVAALTDFIYYSKYDG